MLNSLYVKDDHDKVYTKIVGIFLINNSIPTYVDAHGKKHTVGLDHVIDINHIVDPYLGIKWYKDGLTFRTYTTKYLRGE